MKRLIAIIGSRPRPIRFLASRLLWKSGVCRFLMIRREGYRLRFFPTSLSTALWELGGAERLDEERLIRELVRPGDTFVDIGANIGALSIVGRLAAGSSGRVISVEAHPKIFGYLEQNLALNGLSAEIHNCAVGAAAGELTFTDHRSDDQNRAACGDEHGIKVPMLALDELLADVADIRLLKIDVEGFEYFVLKGAADVLKRTDYVFFESWDDHAIRFGYTVPDLVRLLQDSGYRVYGVANGAREPVTPDHRSPNCENLLAVREAGGAAEPSTALMSNLAGVA